MKTEKVKPRIKTTSFVAEFPLRTTADDEMQLCIRLDAGRQIYNACLGEALRRLTRLRHDICFEIARKMAPGTQRTAIFQALNEQYGFLPGEIQKYAERCRDACWIGDHLGSHDTQSTSKRAFSAVEQYAFGARGKPRFKSYGQISSIEGKNNEGVITLRNGKIRYFGLSMPLILDDKDRDKWQAQALSCRTKFCRIVRRSLNGRDRYYVQLVQEGLPPKKARHTVGSEVFGIDAGPSHIALVSETTAELIPLCQNLPSMTKELRTLDRKIDRQRRANNPANYGEDGKPKSSCKWKQSNRQKKVATQRKEIHRKLTAERKRDHGELANKILAIGKKGKAENVSYKAWTALWGKSIGKKAPSLLMGMVGRKAESAGGSLTLFKTKTTKLSQFDHTTGEYVKKPLSQRIHIFGDGITAPVQRDIYSAYLARFVESDRLSVIQVIEAWVGAEPLLRRATEEFLQVSKVRNKIPNRVWRKIRKKQALRGRETRSSKVEKVGGENQPRKMSQLSLLLGEFPKSSSRILGL